MNTLALSPYHPIRSSSDFDLTLESINGEKRQTFSKSHRQLKFVSFFCVILIVLLLLIIGYEFRQLTSLCSRSHLHDLQINNLPLAPEFPLVTKVFREGEPVKKITPEIEEQWEADMPRGRGFVQVSIASSEEPAEDTFSIAAFHQLHCLFMIQKSFTKALNNASQVSAGEIHHTYHCTELIRQALKCNADPTLDTITISPDIPTGRGATGWNGTHICRDYDRLFSWAEQHRTYDGIGSGVKPVHEHT